MRRLLGPTGAPQIIAPILIGQAPLLDFTTTAQQRALRGRTVFVDLWAYLPDGAAAIAGSAYPAFFANMIGETQLDPTQACVFLSNKNTLALAVANLNHRILAEVRKSTTDTVPPVGTWFSDLGPTHVLKRFPLNGPVALWFLHNMTGVLGDRQVYVWGYYTIEDEDNNELSRALQANAYVAQTQYLTPIAESDDQEIAVHEVTSDYIDEVDLEVSLAGFDGGSPGVDDTALPATAVHKLVFGDTIAMPIWAGGDGADGEGGGSTTATTNRVMTWTKWLDGIPMRGVGQIKLQRPLNAAATCRSTARGSFLRY